MPFGATGGQTRDRSSKVKFETGNLKLAGDSGGLRATRGQTMLTVFWTGLTGSAGLEGHRGTDMPFNASRAGKAKKRSYLRLALIIKRPTAILTTIDDVSGLGNQTLLTPVRITWNPSL